MRRLKNEEKRLKKYHKNHKIIESEKINSNKNENRKEYLINEKGK